MIIVPTHGDSEYTPPAAQYSEGVAAHSPVNPLVTTIPDRNHTTQKVSPNSSCRTSRRRVDNGGGAPRTEDVHAAGPAHGPGGELPQPGARQPGVRGPQQTAGGRARLAAQK